jgi:hypothetical protein
MPDLLHGCSGSALDIYVLVAVFSIWILTGNPTSNVLQYCHMGNTLTVRFPEKLLERLREKSRRSGLPVGQVVRQFVENGLSEESPTQQNQAWRKYVGIIKGGPKDVSSRKGFSRG